MNSKYLKLIFSLFILVFLFAEPALARDFNGGLKSIFADVKIIAYTLCAITAVGAAILVLTNMQAGIQKYMSVVLAVIIIATSLAAVTYLTNTFGG